MTTRTPTLARVTLDARALSKALGLLTPITRVKTNNPATAHVMIQTAADGITLYVTDFARSLSLRVESQPDLLAEPSAFGVEAAALAAFVSARDGTVTLEQTERGCTVRAGSAWVKLPVIDGEDLPRLADDGWDLVAEIPAGEWARQSRRVMAAVAGPRDSRPILTGVHVVSTGTHLQFEGADGYQLMLAPVVEHGGDVNLVIPTATMQTATSITTTDAPVQLFTRGAGNSVRLVCGPATLTAQTILGAYPNTRQLMPPLGETRVRVVREDVLAETARLRALTGDGAQVRLYADDAGDHWVLRLAARGGDGAADAEASLVCTVAGPAAKIALNVNYLRDALDAAGTDFVELCWSGTRSPLTILPDPDDGWRAVVMPVYVEAW